MLNPIILSKKNVFRSLAVVFICIYSNLSSGQVFSLEEIRKMESVGFKEALNMHPDSVFSISLNETDIIPAKINQFKNLHSILLFSCSNMDLDKELPKLAKNSKLIEIEILSNDYKKFPKSILEFSKLKSLTLSGLKFDLVPDQIKNLKDLEILTLGHPFSGGCGIKKLPSCLTELEKLHTLRLWGNMDLKIDENFGKLNSLKELELTYINCDLNTIYSISPNLEILDITGTELTNLDGIEKLKKIKSLAISHQATLTDLGPAFKQLDNLEELSLYFNKDIFNSSEFIKISNLTHLKKLIITLNKDCKGPIPFPQTGFTNLKTLSIETLSSTKLGSVIKSIAHFDSLQHLTLDQFQDNELPKALFDLYKLKGLILNSIPLESIPKDIKKLNLEYLRIWNIKLTDLPKEMAEIDELKYLYIGSTSINAENSVIKKLIAKKVKVEGI